MATQDTKADHPSPTELRLLALVDKERTGREVAALYRQEVGKAISFGTLYTTFRRMKKEGWVTSRDDELGDGRNQYFLITEAGKGALTGGREYYAYIAKFRAQGTHTARANNERSSGADRSGQAR